MMGTPQFVTLAQVDRQHFITACQHGIVHLTWGRVTSRLSHDEFRLLSALLDRATKPESAAPTSHGGLRITYRPDSESEVRIDAQAETWLLLLAPSKFHTFHQAVRSAAERLTEILSSGVWDKADDAEEETPPNPLEQLRRSHFSRN